MKKYTTASCPHIIQLLFILLIAVMPFRVWYRGKVFEGEDVEAELVFSQALCECGFVPKWCEEEEMD